MSRRVFDAALAVLWAIAGLLNLGAVLFTKWEPFTLLNACIVLLAVVSVREHYKKWRTG